jgi:hypothetical protein
MILKISRETDAHAIAAALQTLYPSYRYTARRRKGDRLYTIAVHCAATGTLLITRVEV